MTGVDQSLMVAVGMVVIAGIVGAGGLGFVIYEAIRMLDIGKAIDGGIAIVIVTVILDAAGVKWSRVHPKTVLAQKSWESRIPPVWARGRI